MLMFSRIYSLAKDNGVSITFLCSKVGRPRYYLRDAENKGISIPPDVISTWAQILNTTPEYLTGETDIKEKPTATESNELSQEAIKLASRIEKLSPENRAKLSELIDLYQAYQGKK